MSKNSNVWDYFKVSEEDNSKAICLLCADATISRGGTICKQFTTTNLRNHIRTKHPVEFQVLSAKDEEKSKKRESEQTENLESASARKMSKSQLTIKSCIDKTKKWDLNSTNAKKITNLIGEMMALDNQPFIIVEDIGFRRLMNHIAPSYPLPSRFHFSEKVIPNLYDKAKLVIAEKLKTDESISFTTDIWTCQHSNQSFISLSAHWVTDSLQSFVLHSSLFEGNHTGQAIADKFKTMLDSWNIPVSRCHMVITDNAANMINGIDLVHIARGPCFLHTLQLAIQDGIMSQRSVSDMIVRSKRVVTHFNHSALACGRLSKIQEDLNLSQKKLVQDVPTRWNSTFYLLQRLLEMKTAIVFYASEHDLQVPTPHEWKLMENVIRLLQPFEEYTKLLSSDNAPISVVIPSVAVLQHFLNKDDSEKSFGVRTMKKEFHDAVKSRFVNVITDPKYIIATSVDPRFKTTFTQAHGRELLLREVRKLNIQDNVAEPIDSGDNTRPPSQLSASTSNRMDLWDCFDDLVTTWSTSRPNTSTENSIEEKEIDTFLAIPLVARDECPYKWWATQKSVFPNVYKVAKTFLSAPCSSVYSERIFSEAGNILNENRARLHPTKSESLLFLHHNLPRLNFTY